MPKKASIKIKVENGFKEIPAWLPRDVPKPIIRVKTETGEAALHFTDPSKADLKQVRIRTQNHGVLAASTSPPHPGAVMNIEIMEPWENPSQPDYQRKILEPWEDSSINLQSQIVETWEDSSLASMTVQQDESWEDSSISSMNLVKDEPWELKT